MIKIQLFKYFMIVVQLDNFDTFVGTVLNFPWRSLDSDKRHMLQRLNS